MQRGPGQLRHNVGQIPPQQKDGLLPGWAFKEPKPQMAPQQTHGLLHSSPGSWTSAPALGSCPAVLGWGLGGGHLWADEQDEEAASQENGPNSEPRNALPPFPSPCPPPRQGPTLMPRKPRTWTLAPSRSFPFSRFTGALRSSSTLFEAPCPSAI